MTGLRDRVEDAIAIGYGLTYDAVVHRFEPYEALLAEVADLVERSPASPIDVLDVACGIGNVSLYLAKRGHRVCGIDAVGRLIDVARRKHRRAGSPPNSSFRHCDLARDPLEGSCDVLVSMNTLYWHPDPEALLAGCRRALRPSGRAVFLTYDHPAQVLDTALAIRALNGTAASARALRWLVPTAVFESLRDHEPRYLNEREFHDLLNSAGFEVIEARRTFLAGICHLAWTQ